MRHFGNIKQIKNSHNNKKTKKKEIKKNDTYIKNDGKTRRLSSYIN